MSLRTRLVGTVVGLLLAGLVLTGGATFGALVDWRESHSDNLLRLAAGQITTVLSTGTAAPGSRQPALEQAVAETSAMWRLLAEHGDVPAFFQVRDGAGRVRETVAFGPGPALPDELPPDSRPDGELFRTVTGPPAPWQQQPVTWRIRLAPLAAGSSDLVLVGQRATVSDELVARIRNVLLGTGIAVLAGLVALSAVLVRRELRPLDDIGATAAAIGAGDLTRRVGSPGGDTEIGRLGRALNAMLGQLEQAFDQRRRSEERLRRFVADASHELRTPVATIRGYAELFRRGAAQRPDDLADAMHRIEAEATRMGEMVDELLLLARLDQGRPLEREPVDIGAIADEAVRAAAAVEPDRAIDLRIDGDTVVLGDAARLRQVLGNLLGNVRAHTPAGAPAQVLVTGTADSVRIAVVDNGPGLPPDERGRVFERFYQAPRAETANEHDGHGGTGLGLAIVAAVAKAHDGTVEASAADGGGCRFTIHLPRPAVAPP
ncbi:sensor histidine kinase [Pseudonocardia kunmingensis]|uniref:histidine kinase n=1 Tax=Pseudonocardia kunmingensis TaxID=630975 RepID=A0A543CYJ0_9PSEU|nr:HAMP domain-containing sensor histidine kinase [Pseudonocardia kunmingensis]TQM02170.1 two-component system OmpR family sensor kinase [Pseudonocardia kunmingensis]